MNQPKTKVETLLTNAFMQHCYSLDELEKSKKNINILHAKNGTFEVRKTEVGKFPIKLNSEIHENSLYYNPELVLNLPKIPEDILYQIRKFFKDVCSRYGSQEAMIQIFWDKKRKRYFTVCLRQRVSSAHVRYFRNLDIEKETENYILVMDIHSHDTMSAFFSGTDDRDEQETRLFGVIGHVTSPEMQMKFRYGVAGKFVDLQKYNIFDTKIADIEQYLYPKQWFDLVTTNRYNDKEMEQVLPNLEYARIKEEERIFDEKVKKESSFTYKFFDFIKGLLKNKKKAIA